MSKQTFVANTILTAAQMNTLQTNDYNQTVSTKTANYVLVATDAGTKIVMNSASATTITVNTSLFAAGDNLTIANIGAGVCTVTAGTATVSSAGPLAIPQYGGGTLYFTSAGVSIFSPTAVTAAAPAAAGLSFISKQTLTAATQHNLTNVFSATYDNYVVKFSNLSVSGGASLKFRCGTSGTPDTASNYSSIGIYYDVSQVQPGGPAFNQSSSFLSDNTATKMGTFLDISSPFLTVTTTYQINNGLLGASTILGNSVVGTINTSTSYTDLVLLSTGNISGTIYIYGYANS